MGLWFSGPSFRLWTKIHWHIVGLAIRGHLFLKFWMVGTWFLAHPRDHRAVTHLENVHQLNIRRAKKLSFQLPHRQLLERKLAAMKFILKSYRLFQIFQSGKKLKINETTTTKSYFKVRGGLRNNIFISNK